MLQSHRRHKIFGESVPTDQPFPKTEMMNEAFETAREETGSSRRDGRRDCSVVTQFVVPGVNAGAVSKTTRLGRPDRLTRARLVLALSRKQKLLLNAQQAAAQQSWILLCPPRTPKVYTISSPVTTQCS